MATKKKMLQAAAGNAGGAGLDITEVFSTYLYEGNGTSNRQITTNINTSDEGGMVWIKNRDGGDPHVLFDTERGSNKSLTSNTSDAEVTDYQRLTAFRDDGFRLGTDPEVNASNGDNYASWTFRKAPKFFDVVTYTGTGSFQNISHNLGSVPGMIVVKKTDGTGDWLVYHRHAHIGQTYQPLPERKYFNLNDTGSVSHGSGLMWGDTPPTDTAFSVSTDTQSNNNGDTYVAYLFAHNDGDGEFGPDSDQDIIKCGSYTGNGSTNGPEIDLGFEPQWVMIKSIDLSGPNWMIFDTMRGWNASEDDYYLSANSSNAEANYRTAISADDLGEPTATGFKLRTASGAANSSGKSYIYMAIRRGPLAQPESGTEVFATDTKNSTGDNKTPLYRSGFPIDLALLLDTDGGSDFPQVHPRLTSTAYLRTNNTAAEQSGTAFTHDFMNGFRTDTSFNADTTRVCHMWKRAPGYFDVVAYTGDGQAGRTVSHNLGVAPEMMWVKNRNATTNWAVYHKDADLSIPQNKYLYLNSTGAVADATVWNDTAPTDSQFTVGVFEFVNQSNAPMIAYLFATLPGVSKVGSYTGNGSGSGQNIDCGFTTGARFILIKRTDSTSNWLVFDTVRGITVGDDPYLKLDVTDAETTNPIVDPYSSGFKLQGTIWNGSGENYIFYAIA